MNPGRTILLLLSFFVAGIHISCNNGKSQDLTKHYSEDMLLHFEKICEKEHRRDTGIYLLDSVYRTFPYQTIPDKYRYYNFKRDLHELIRYGDASYDTAITYLDSMIAVIEANDLQDPMHHDYVWAFNKRSDYFTRRQRYKEAIEDLTRCKQLNQAAGDSCLMADNTRTMCMIAINQSDFSLAASLQKEALRLENTCIKDWQHYVRMQRYLDDLGYIYANIKNYDSSLYYHFEAVKFLEANKAVFQKNDSAFYDIALSNIYGNIAVAYEFLENYKAAENYINKAIVLVKDTIELAKSRLILGKALFESGRINEAYEVSKLSMPQLDNFDLFFKADLLQLKYKIARARNDYKEASEYQLQIQLIKDSVSKNRINLLKKNPFTEYERLDKKYQVELLEKDNRNQRNKTSAAIIIGVLAMLLVIISVFLLQRLRRVMKKRAIAYKNCWQAKRRLQKRWSKKRSLKKNFGRKNYLRRRCACRWN
ncbi:hypothetical protein [Ferruginibacter sp.]